MSTTAYNYLPTVQQVADVLQVRTRNKFGVMLKNFTAETTPTDLDVDRMINDSVTFVADVIGDTVPDRMIDDAQHLVAIRTAMMIEVSYFAEQIASSRSPYPYLKELYDEELARLQQAASDETGTGADGSQTGYVQWGFPEPSDWLDKRM
jgi:hypothetical protein